MKIVCDACGARYFVSDDKIRKPAVRMTCQKCGHVIVARRDEAAAVAAATRTSAELRARLGLGAPSAPILEPTVSGDDADEPAASEPRAAAESLDWYVSRDGQSQGPFSKTGLLERFVSGELGSECYVWHRLLGAWQPAHSTEPFAAAIVARTAPPPTPISAAAALAAAADAAQMTSAAPERSAASFSARLHGLRERLDSIELDAIDDDGEEESVDGLTTVDEDGGEPRAAEEPSAVPAAPAESAAVEAEPSAGAIDLEVDGASRVLTRGELDAQARRSADALPPPSPIEPPPIDLDVDGASRVVSYAEVARRAGRSVPELDGADDDVAERGSARTEHSALIDIDHLRRQNRRTRLWVVLALIAVLGAVVAVVVLATGEDKARPEPATRSEGRQAVSAPGGAAIDASEFDRLAPEDDFELLGAAEDADPVSDADDGVEVAPQKARRIDSGRRRRGSTRSLADEGEERAVADASLRVGEHGDGALADAPRDSGSSATRPTQRERVALEPAAAGELLEGETRRGSKYAGTVKGEARSRFVGGLKQVSRSVTECRRRHEEREGALPVKKVYLELRVEADGAVSSLEIEAAARHTYFASCLDELRGGWTFEPSDGPASTLRQGFVLE